MRRLILPLLLTLLAHPPASAADAPAPVLIAIQPLDSVKAERLQVVKSGLEETFGLKVVVLTERPLAKDAWYAPRGRYRAEKLLDQLNDGVSIKYQIVVGVTGKDISTTKGDHEDWGIFGLGEVGGRACVLSTFRLAARGADESRLRDRLRKIAIHEVGHVMGLDHCPRDGCVMHDAESSIATVDGESGKFCESCVAGWERWLREARE